MQENKKSFSNELLCKKWREAADGEPKGTRRDVVESIMEEIGEENTHENFSRHYNNAMQRVKQLKKAGATFPELAEGKRGRRRTSDEIAKLEKILNG